MRKASIRDLHIRTSELVSDASAAAVIVIERRGEPVAELRPLSRKKRKIRFPDMSRIWNTFPQLPADSERFIEEDRNRCS
jgi:antitoxin (DNA-binding transcriptional repressor) of toxin-antitoxin stability system